MEAPNFNGEYPGEAKMLGPAWQAAWSILEDSAWHTRTELVAYMMEASGAQSKTCENLLWEARNRGVLQGKGRQGGKRYRIAPIILSGQL